ncbi:MAG: shikimate kinase [Oscillospiraceae bacterium]|nr:shikimate kinase [Oscillospiraceae bacterium]
MERSIVLCGFMGCGKSTSGRELARRLDYEFIDMDAYIEDRACCTIPQIFAQKGEAGFRDLEHQAARELSSRPRLVVASGGGALLYPRNVQAFSSCSVVFLDVPFEDCYRRVLGSDRPLIQQKSREEVLALYERRRPLYLAAAALRVPGALSSEETAEAVLCGLGI